MSISFIVTLYDIGGFKGQLLSYLSYITEQTTLMISLRKDLPSFWGTRSFASPAIMRSAMALPLLECTVRATFRTKCKLIKYNYWFYILISYYKTGKLGTVERPSPLLIRTLVIWIGLAVRLDLSRILQN